MEIEARYVKTSEDGVRYIDHSTLLNYVWIDNELATLSRAKFLSKDYSPNCRFNDLAEYSEDDDRFYIDEVADEVIFHTLGNSDSSSSVSMDERPSISTYSNLGRSKAITLLLDEEVKYVKFLNSDQSKEVVYEIEDKYKPFKKLFIVLSSAVSDFNLIKSIHELSDHPHYSLNSDVVTISNAVPGALYDGLVDLRNGTKLGSSETNVEIK